MKHLNYFFLIKILFFYFVGFSQGSKSNVKEIVEYFEKQKRIESDEVEYDNPHILTNKDLELTFPIIKKALLDNGYIDRMFIDRVDKIFSLKNEKSTYNYAKYFDVSCLKWEINNFLKETYWVDRKQYIMINFENKVITDAFSLKEIVEFKNDEIKLKVPQKIIARNMYLFNDSKAHFKWLILNDQYFMRNLVTTFGYYDDTALVEWVVENTKMDAQNLEPLNEIIYNKKCDGKIGFNYTFFQIISEDEEKATEKFNFLKWYYFDWLLNPKNTLELTFSQKAEIIARMHSFIYSNMNDYRTYEFMGTFAENYDYDNAYSKEFKAKNYYNIPDFEKQWKEAKLEGDGITLPGEME